jgi:DNA mismatch endonuclease (patch repair protein)
MADIFSPTERSLLMAKIRGRGNVATEIRLMMLFRMHGIRGWRRHLPLPGKPDFAFPKQRLVVFVDGCFWHGCPIHFRAPQTRVDFWAKKIAENRARDARVTRQLKRKGWRVIRVWQHSLVGSKMPSVLHQIERRLLETQGQS